MYADVFGVYVYFLDVVDVSEWYDRVTDGYVLVFSPSIVYSEPKCLVVDLSTFQIQCCVNLEVHLYSFFLRCVW